ncbi:integrase [Rheinheimera mesophila]|uniref:Integrase n=1 Tax=Rheinheimera mesophila TaxID=1547515 RepID=A0A3P3QMS0_9GAMM|nr:phage integrase Arm DNA-binding domain-containing protein [Rheinheimera mesophila]KKL00285.1 integrase [Rheinheimera mesophila]RRJ22542.1 integrase [Rheinheimera mesophila]
MAPRQRTDANKDFPVGLYTKRVRGKLRYYFVREDGTEKWFPIGVARGDAIAAAHAYNAKYRVQQLAISERGDKYNKPLSHWVPVVLQRVKKEEKLGANAISTFEADCKRLVEQFGTVMSKAVNLETVNAYLELNCSGKSNNVYNRKISFLRKVFDYLCDMSAMAANPAELKKVKPKDEKKRQRMDLNAFKQIEAAAPLWLKTAMNLALQTTHAVLEVSRIKYRDCEYFPVPVIQNGLEVFGVMRIHRQKVQKKEASRVAIPITAALKQIIDASRQDHILSPYIVHKRKTDSNPVSKEVSHETQLVSTLISRTFSELRDELGIYEHLDKDSRPTFHEIRALSIHLFTQMGIDPQARAAHTDSKSTKIYQRGHVEWVEVPAAELAI